MTGGKAHPVVAPPWVFYSAPFVTRGLWIRSDLSTAQVDCPLCGSKRWEPCKSIKLGKELPGSTRFSPKFEKIVGGYTGMTHSDRRKAAKDVPSSGLEITVRGIGSDPGPPSGGYRIALALPPTVMEGSGEEKE
jgi:hypothetical protein